MVLGTVAATGAIHVLNQSATRLRAERWLEASRSLVGAMYANPRIVKAKEVV